MMWKAVSVIPVSSCGLVTLTPPAGIETLGEAYKPFATHIQAEMKLMQERVDQLEERNGQLEKDLEIAKGGTDNGSNVRRV
jgi:hypothetical protein